MSHDEIITEEERNHLHAEIEIKYVNSKKLVLTTKIDEISKMIISLQDQRQKYLTELESLEIQVNSITNLPPKNTPYDVGIQSSNNNFAAIVAAIRNGTFQPDVSVPEVSKSTTPTDIPEVKKIKAKKEDVAPISIEQDNDLTGVDKWYQAITTNLSYASNLAIYQLILSGKNEFMTTDVLPLLDDNFCMYCSTEAGKIRRVNDTCADLCIRRILSKRNKSFANWTVDTYIAPLSREKYEELFKNLSVYVFNKVPFYEQVKILCGHWIDNSTETFVNSDLFDYLRSREIDIDSIDIRGLVSNILKKGEDKKKIIRLNRHTYIRADISSNPHPDTNIKVEEFIKPVKPKITTDKTDTVVAEAIEVVNTDTAPLPVLNKNKLSSLAKHAIRLLIDEKTDLITSSVVLSKIASIRPNVAPIDPFVVDKIITKWLGHFERKGAIGRLRKDREDTEITYVLSSKLPARNKKESAVEHLEVLDDVTLSALVSETVTSYLNNPTNRTVTVRNIWDVLPGDLDEDIYLKRVCPIINKKFLSLLAKGELVESTTHRSIYDIIRTKNVPERTQTKEMDISLVNFDSPASILRYLIAENTQNFSSVDVYELLSEKARNAKSYKKWSSHISTLLSNYKAAGYIVVIKQGFPGRHQNNLNRTTYGTVNSNIYLSLQATREVSGTNTARHAIRDLISARAFPIRSKQVLNFIRNSPKYKHLAEKVHTDLINMALGSFIEQGILLKITNSNRWVGHEYILASEVE